MFNQKYWIIFVDFILLIFSKSKNINIIYVITYFITFIIIANISRMLFRHLYLQNEANNNLLINVK